MSSHDRRRRLRSPERNRNSSSRRKRSFEAAALQDDKVERSYSPFSLLRTQTKRRSGLGTSREAASGERGGEENGEDYDDCYCEDCVVGGSDTF